MTEPPTDQDQPRFKRISPAPFSAPKGGTGDGPGARDRQRRGGGIAISIALGVLVAIAIGVFTYLPGLAPVPQPETVQKPDTPAPAQSGPATTSASKPEPASPWQQAQEAKLRKESQDILARLLERQETLKERGVEQWAAKEFSEALDRADAGDEAYRHREFEQAVSLYTEALAGLDALVERIDTVYTDAMDRGRAALEAGDSGAAASAFATALLVQPGDAEAEKGARRADSLDAVLELVSAGIAQREAGELEAARGSFEKAASLDPDHAKAAAELSRTQVMITDAAFTRAMSRGFSAFDSGSYQEARAAFREALKLKPGAEQATSALRQTENRVTSIRIGNLLDQAGAHENAERWKDAVSVYEEALKLDPNLASAQQGRQFAAGRLALDQRLKETIAQPGRLHDPAVHDEASRLYAQAAGVIDPGPRLKKQIVVLSQLLKEAETPVVIRLESDNQTSVTVYKVGRLGRFDTRELTLLPGTYVAVGSREGYRDVRVEFEVSATESNPPVTVQCNEKLALGS